MLRNKKGFSLIELMVVVAIIGVLATIAIPSINKYMARARQTDAKTNLASIYTANKAFYAEFNVYDDRFNVIGYRPEGKLRYNVGWSATAGCAVATFGYTSPLTGAEKSNAVAHCGTGAAVGANGCTVLADGNQALAGTAIACAAGAPMTFIAGAVGKIASSAAAVDTWTIDQNKDLQNTVDGTQ